MTIHFVFSERNPPTSGWVNVYDFGHGQEYGCLYQTREAAAASAPAWVARYRLRVRPWIAHDGGPCPVAADVLVRVRMRDGWSDFKGVPAGAWAPMFSGNVDFWRRKGSSKNDIVAYQIVDAPAEATR